MRKTAIVLLCLATFATACKDGAKKNENVLLQPFATPFQTPPFEQIKMSDYKPAFVEGIRQQEAEIEAIVNNPEEPTFENTVAALDRSGELLNRVASIFFNLQGANTSDEMQQLAMEISPLVTAHSDAINMNPGLFARVKYPYNISSLTQSHAIEALKDPFQVDKWIRTILLERSRVIDAINMLPNCKRTFPTNANFFLAEMDDAQSVYNYLVSKGIIVRNRTRVTLCANCLRITIGTKSENNELLAALRQYR